MSEKTLENIIRDIFEPLNLNDKFKELFKEESFSILLYPNDDEKSLLISVDKGIVSIESILNEPKQNIDKEILGWNSRVESTDELLKGMFDGTLDQKAITKLFIKRKIKVKNLKFLLKLQKLREV